MHRKRGRFVTILRYIAFVCCIFIIIVVCQVKKSSYKHIRSKIHISARKYIDFRAQKHRSLSIRTIKRLITRYNREENILNLDLFGHVIMDAPVLVIFVDKYRTSLNFFLASLYHVKGIADALVIFSHSYYDENVNALIKKIDFTRVLQIYYPYSLQVYPRTFPGYQTGDCRTGMNADMAKYMNCTGANSPDTNGRFRDPVLAEKKHFWWWTMNHVFENITHTASLQGIFIYLNHDVYLMEDFMYVTLLMRRICKWMLQCDLVSLGILENLDGTLKPLYAGNIRIWEPRKYPSMLAFDSSVWESMKANSNLFCNFDDYSWANSLFHLSLNRNDGNSFKVISSAKPRVYRTNELLNDYEPLLRYEVLDAVCRVINMQIENHGQFYPSQLEIFVHFDMEKNDTELIDKNGGWNDPRDKQLCLNITESEARQYIVDINNQDDVQEEDISFKDYSLTKIS